MAYLGRKGAVAPLTSADIPVGIVEGTDIAFLENASGTQNLGGTYSTERMYLNDSYTLTGDVTITGHLALGTVADSDVVITQDSTERTITGSGTLESGDLLSRQIDLNGMTGTLANSVQDNITRLGTVTTGTFEGTLGSTTFTGVAGQKTAKAWATINQDTVLDSYNVSSSEDHGTGDYSVHFATAMANTNYCAVGGMLGATTNTYSMVTRPSGWTGYAGGKSTIELRFQCPNLVSVSDATNQDSDHVNILVF